MMTHCPLTGVCLKRFIVTVIAGFIFAYAYDWFVNANFMMDLYDQTPQLWRSEANMQETLWVIWLYELLLVWVSAFLFTRNYENKGMGEGVRFGVILGLLLGIEMAASYAWLPISGELAIAWFVTSLIKGIGLGVIYALTYRDDKILAGKI
jgi:hypothetical protein